MIPSSALRLVVRARAPGTRAPDPVSGACFARSRSPWPPPFAPPTPQHRRKKPPPPCSSASQLLLRGLTSRARASSATAPRLPDADRRPLTERSNASSPGSQRQGASAHARFYDHAGPYGHSRCRAHTYCLPPAERRRRPSCRSFAAQWLACAYPYRRFACTLAGTRARLGADAVRYSFIVADFHRLLLAGFTGALCCTPGFLTNSLRCRLACRTWEAVRH